MKILKAYKYKLKTNGGLEQKLASFAGCCRKVWNLALARNMHRLESKQHILYYQEMAYWLTFWKQTDEMSFLKEVPAQALQQKLRDLERAFKDGFDKKQPLKRLPKFKRKGQRDSFRYPQGFKFDGNRVFLPKIGWVGFFNSRRLEGTAKNVTVVREANGWHLCVQVEIEASTPEHPSKTAIGVDRGVVVLAALSDGRCYSPVNSYRPLEEKLAKAQRQMSRKQKFSCNWKKQQEKIRKIHHKIANCRKDRLHWVSNKISKNHAMIVLEQLKVSNMSKSAKGTVEAPGKNVKAKSGLNKAILDQGWSMFAGMLEYKQAWRGGEVLYVAPHHTSQTCPKCQHISADNRLSQAQFACARCGYQDNADIIGATNVLARGHRVLACGEEALVTSAKQELVRTRERLSPQTATATWESPSFREGRMSIFRFAF